MPERAYLSGGPGPKDPFGSGEQPSITCPRCGRTSYHPDDIREGYCGHCHDWTSQAPGAGGPPLPNPRRARAPQRAADASE